MDVKERARQMALERAGAQPPRPPAVIDCDPTQTDGECLGCSIREGDHTKNCRHHDPVTDEAWKHWKDDLPEWAPVAVKVLRRAA